jgi:hypothetical protein
MEETAFTNAEEGNILWGIASRTPEENEGSLMEQVRACKMLYLKFRFQPALRRLEEIVNVDQSRTKGSLRAQHSATRLLKKFVS